MALENGQEFHLAAILIRRKSVMKIKTNGQKTHPGARRTYPSGLTGYRMHAEHSVSRFARPGDEVIVMRFLKNGDLTMSLPCQHCQDRMREAGIKKVTYSDWDGHFQTMRL